jgi:16S rRNA (cytosine967-C5)-methyltransferase
MQKRPKIAPAPEPEFREPASSIAHVAEQVIRRSSRAHPADAVLRETFQRLRVLSADERRDISRAVFTYFRWRNWLRNEPGIPVQIARALELADRFRENPLELPVDELRAQAVPEWVSAEVAAADEWFRSLQREPELWLRAKRGQGKTLSEKLGHAKTRFLPDALLYNGDTDLFRTPEFHSGEFEVQDISSQAVGFVCDPKPGETWWDACAGEGGKTLHLSDLMENKGLIWASDRAGWRLQNLKRRSARARVFNYRVALWDGGPKLPVKTKFDGVLVDAPCSGVGTWQRNPHARWTTTQADILELADLQKQLLAHAAPAVKPGGRLIYAVCTLTKSETVEVARWFETHYGEFRTVPVMHPLHPEQPVSPQLQIWTQDTGGNGMFIAVWERRQDKPLNR